MFSYIHMHGHDHACSGRLGNAHACTPVGERLPLKTDSYYNYGLDDYTPDPSVCTDKDGWPQHTCTLKTNVTSPPTLDSEGSGM
jgi:hypothetical protein